MDNLEEISYVPETNINNIVDNQFDLFLLTLFTLSGDA